MSNVLMSSYARLPVSFVRGEGVWLCDTYGKRYLDALSGIGVCSLGHAHPGIAEALCEQAHTVIHTSNIYGIPLQEELASRLVALSGMENAFFCNSGAEANEAAIKLARLYGHVRGIAAPSIVVMEGSFHGRTMATLSATGNRKVQAGFEPLVQGFIRVPWNDPEALAAVARNSPDVVAVLLEPVQGEGGVVIPDSGYLSEVRRSCDDNGWLMMLDEIQTGMCKTGKWFACQHDDVVPDVMTLAKALGNGVPVGACLARNEAAGLIQPGNHGSTFGGSPLACRVALAVIETMENEQLARRAEVLGQQMLAGFGSALEDVDGVIDIRGLGLMTGLQLDRPCGDLVVQALDAGILVNVTAGNVIRLLPPLIISNEDADRIVDSVSSLVRDFLHNG